MNIVWIVLYYETVEVGDGGPLSYRKYHFFIFFGTFFLKRIICMILENHKTCYLTLWQYIPAFCFSRDMLQNIAKCIIVNIIIKIHMNFGEFRWPKVQRESLNNVMLPNTVATVNGYMSQRLFKNIQEELHQTANKHHSHWNHSFFCLNGFSLEIVELGPEYLRVFYCVQQGADFQWINTQFCWIRPNED